MTEQDILKLDKVTVVEASEYMHQPKMAIMKALQQGRIPIGWAVEGEQWSYHIIPKRLVMYMNGQLS